MVPQPAFTGKLGCHVSLSDGLKLRSGAALSWPCEVSSAQNALLFAMCPVASGGTTQRKMKQGQDKSQAILDEETCNHLQQMSMQGEMHPEAPKR